MAEQPKRAAMRAELERMTREEFGEEPATALDFADVWVGSGKTILALAEELARRTGRDIQRDALSKYLNGLERDATEGTLTRARARGAHAMVEQALERASSVVDKDDAQVAALQVRTLQWTAERYNPQELGQSKAPSVVVNLGALYLDALRAPPPARPVIASDIAEDAELLSIEAPKTSELAERSTRPLDAPA